MCECDICVEDRRRDELEKELGFNPTQLAYIKELRDIVFSIDLDKGEWRSFKKSTIFEWK